PGARAACRRLGGELEGPWRQAGGVVAVLEAEPGAQRGTTGSGGPAERCAEPHLSLVEQQRLSGRERQGALDRLGPRDLRNLLPGRRGELERRRDQGLVARGGGGDVPPRSDRH